MARWLVRALIFCAFTLMFFTPAVRAQDSSENCGLSVSLLTCSPGEELYSTFGHSALRVVDTASGMDIIFNYGTFDFSDPDFYSKFVRGKLLYFVSIQDFRGFVEDYRYEQRSIIEQPLNLDCRQKQQLFAALRENLKEANKYYKYDFLYDNCSTRLADMVEANSGRQVTFGNIVGSDPPTFRELLHVYLKNGQMFWSRLGIDILLGSPVDKQVTSRQAMFLPDYLMMGFDSARVNGLPLVASKRTVLNIDKPAAGESLLTRPIVITSILLLVVWGLMFTRKIWASRLLHLFDHAFFFLLGALGVFLLFMWFGTEHKVCAYNYNLLWALPFNLVAAFCIHSKKHWVQAYLRIIAIWYFVLFFGWALLPQDMNSAIIPLVIIAFMRSVVHFRKTV